MRLINDIHDRNLSSYNVSNRAYVHSSYNFDKFTNDIAIIEYPENFDFGVEPIRLASDFVENEGEMAFAVGYGKYQPNDSASLIHSYHLREGVFVFREPEYCKETWTKPNIKQKICSGEYGRGTSLGDSGGPLMKNGDDGKWYQVGICSYGRKNSMFDRKTYPGISTRISYYCPWIEKVTRGEAKCQPYERTSKLNVAEGLLVEKLVLNAEKIVCGFYNL
uniref:Peptidase S1 domain-containing protein n=1 Tax=Panagrolaimus sp. PS1159 TaxID=55785 RepID=A0AC35FL61_9BILA